MQKLIQFDNHHIAVHHVSFTYCYQPTTAQYESHIVVVMSDGTELSFMRETLDQAINDARDLVALINRELAR